MSPQGGISSSFQMRDKCCRVKAAQRSRGVSAEGGGPAGDEGAGGDAGEIGRE